jgi:hypothetical protein
MGEGCAGCATGKSRAGAGELARRVGVALLVAGACVACTAAPAQAYTLQIVFADGQPLTYGSACTGNRCLQRDAHVEQTDALGLVELPDRAKAIEYRRDGIDPELLPAGAASGTIAATGDGARVVLPRVLAGSAPAVDPVESDLVARLNEERAARGLPLAQINARLSAAADLQATWLTQTGVSVTDPGLFHIGPFGTGLAFRRGEVSMPDPGSGGEIAEGGGTIDETVYDWMSSEDHRREVLAPGELLMGVARVGAFVIV